MKYILTDYALVKVEKKFEDEMQVGGTTLYRNITGSELTGGTYDEKTQSEIAYLHKKLEEYRKKPDKYRQEIKQAYGELEHVMNHDTQMETSYNANKDIRIFGTVIQPPSKLSDRMLYLEDNGEPEPLRNVGYDEIKMANGFIRPEQYFPSPYKSNGFKMNDLKIDIQTGDKVYFHYLAINEDNIIDKEPLEHTINGKLSVDWHVTYKIPYEQIFARVRGGKLTPINTHVLCEYEFEDNVSRHGIILSSTEKPKYLVAKIRNVNEENDLGLSNGDVIYYLPYSNFENTIEGEKCLVLKEREIIAKVD